MTPLSAIGARDWQPALGSLGEVVTDLADIAQAIDIILTTPRGSDPHRPTFGADLLQFIDQPEIAATAPLIAAAASAILAWEPRLDLISITPTFGLGQVTLAIGWTRRGSAATATTQVSL